MSDVPVGARFNSDFKSEPLRWEVGSDYHWLKNPSGDYISWPQPATWFGLARDALTSIWTICSGSSSAPYVWIPDYFCPVIHQYWKSAGILLKVYSDDPLRKEPVWETIDAEPGDLVLAVNYFAIRVGEGWASWKNQHPDVLLIEDHTHDPGSAWAHSSEADYAFASLRKTCPAPDGGILWSPAGKQLPEDPDGQDWRGNSMKLASMILKRDYLEGGPTELKPVYREFQIESEKLYSMLGENALPPWSRFLYQRGLSVAWREKRERNVKYLLDRIAPATEIQPLFSEWPEGACPFNVVLLLKDEESRDFLRARLASAKIYTPVHWGPEMMTYPESINLSKRILTIPADQRYEESDMERVAAALMSAD